MNKYHHITVMSFTAEDGSKRLGIYAARKVFSKGGKLEFVCAVIGRTTPTLTDAKHIIEGVTITRATATQLLFDAVGFGKFSAELAVDAAGDYDGVANAVRDYRINVIDTCRENDRECFTAAALAAFDARVKALGVMPVEKMEQARELLNLRATGKLPRDNALFGLLNAYPLECQQIDLYERARREREAKTAAAAPAPAPVLSQFRVTFKRWGEVVHTAVVSVEHRYQALDTAANEHCAKVRDGKAEAFIYDTHTVDLVGEEVPPVTAPVKPEARILRDALERIALASPGSNPLNLASIASEALRAANQSKEG